MINEPSQGKSQKGDGLLRRLRTEFSFIQGNFLIMVTSWLILDFATEMPMTYFPLFIKELGGTVSTVGLITGSMMIANAIVQIPGGYLTDKYGRKWLIASMTLAAALANIFYILAPSWQFILLGAVISGLCKIYQPALNAIVMDSLPKERRGIGFSIVNLISSASTTPAPLIAGYLYSIYGLVPSVRLGFIVALIGFLIAAILRFRLEETIEEPDPINLKELVYTIPESIKESITVWRHVPKSAFFLFIMQVTSMFSIGIFQPVFAFYIIEDLGIGEVNFSYIMTTLFVSMILLSLPVGKLIDIIGKKKPLIAIFIVWITASFLFIYGNFFRVLIAMTMIGLLLVLINTAGSALSADLVPKVHRGKTGGAIGFFTMIAQSGGMALGGYIYDNVSHQLPFWLNIFLPIIPMLLTVFFIKEPKPEDISET